MVYAIYHNWHYHSNHSLTSSYRGIILFYWHHLSLPAAVPACVWVACESTTVYTINEPIGRTTIFVIQNYIPIFACTCFRSTFNLFLFNGYLWSFAGIERPGREVIHSPPSSAEVKNMLSYTSRPLRCGRGRLYVLNLSDIISKDTNLYIYIYNLKESVE